MLSIDPVDRLSRTNTSSPRSRSASERCDPTKPAPPVISTRIDSVLTLQWRGAAARAPASRCGVSGCGRAALPPDRPSRCRTRQVRARCRSSCWRNSSSYRMRRSAGPDLAVRPRPAMTPASTNGDRLLGRPMTSAGTPSDSASTATVELTVTTAPAAAQQRRPAARRPGARGCSAHAAATAGVDVRRFGGMRLDRELHVRHRRAPRPTSAGRKRRALPGTSWRTARAAVRSPAPASRRARSISVRRQRARRRGPMRVEPRAAGDGERLRRKVPGRREMARARNRRRAASSAGRGNPASAG